MTVEHERRQGRKHHFNKLQTVTVSVRQESVSMTLIVLAFALAMEEDVVRPQSESVSQVNCW